MLVVGKSPNLSVVWRIIVPENAILFLRVMVRIRKCCRGSLQVEILPELEDGTVGEDERPLHISDVAGHLGNSQLASNQRSAGGKGRFEQSDVLV